MHPARHALSPGHSQALAPTHHHLLPGRRHGQKSGNKTQGQQEQEGLTIILLLLHQDRGDGLHWHILAWQPLEARHQGQPVGVPVLAKGAMSALASLI